MAPSARSPGDGSACRRRVVASDQSASAAAGTVLGRHHWKRNQESRQRPVSAKIDAHVVEHRANAGQHRPWVRSDEPYRQPQQHRMARKNLLAVLIIGSLKESANRDDAELVTSGDACLRRASIAE